MDERKWYLDYFELMQEEHVKQPLGGMAWDDISWHAHEAVNTHKLFTREELLERFPKLFG